jgi:hypothetical protein
MEKRRGTETLGMQGYGIDALLFQYLYGYIDTDTTTIPDAVRTGWNNAIEFISSNISVNADFSQWLVSQFNDKETGEAYVKAFSEFIRKDLFTNEKEN